MPDRRIDKLNSTRLLGGVEQPLPLFTSRADAVVDSLAHSIESGELAPGDPLSVTALVQRLNVAAGTVRSALGALEAMHLIDHRLNRASVVVTPTPAWFVAVAAECSGLSIAAADLGIAQATDAQIAEFAACAATVRELWETDDNDQVVGAEGLWELLDLLAVFSRNRYLSTLHASKRPALVLGIRSLSRPRNPAMLRSVVDALVAAARDRDRLEATDLVRDLYTFVVDGVTDL
ncbi:GntR family transcriptional regulator [Microbacterium sp. APC 3901]|uniref:GntR family transcriptional regulator n=1 Tax=Microbacterium sp. APC 3901 TaxID=3035192 RepID=UPI0025B402BD|nr:GntR family transcriptional regulator [Microbacterium sp. APC 3901]MDN3444340.1 GntR family transcriptional regulator [Microbacterium sp. APC 3901]